MRPRAASASAPVSLPPFSARDGGAHPLPPHFERGPVEVDHPHVEAGPGRGFGDARTHETAAHDAYPLDLHCFSPVPGITAR
jgi:hypothetical protein